MKMLLSTGFLVIVLVGISCGEGKHDPNSSLVSPTPTTPSPVLTAPRPAAITFEMSGIVTDDEGAPVSGAKVSALRDYDDLASSLTDRAGAYKLSFTAVPGGNHYPWDPAGTEESMAFAQVEVAGYERYFRYVVGTTPQLVVNMRLERIRRISLGETTVLTISPDDTVCVSDVWPGRDLVCEIVHVVAPVDGEVVVRATGSGAKSPTIEFYARSGQNGTRGNPATLHVSRGTEYVLDVGIPWGTSDSVRLVATATQ
jgi:hypothetical protein